MAEPLAAVRSRLREEECIAKIAYESITEDGPVEVPTWEHLSHVERRHLILFARQVMWIAEEGSGMTYSPLAPVSLHFLTTSVEINGITLPICITYEYDPGEPPYRASRYDPPEPGSPPSAKIIGIRVRLGDGWMAASERVWGVVEGDVDIYEQMIDAALEDIAGADMAAREAQMEFRNA